VSWVIYVVVQTLFIVAGIRRERAAGLWSWSKFLFALAFAALEITLVSVPLAVFDMRLTCAAATSARSLPRPA
jgi:hypothetical protein